jgi:hypothetical protein
MKDMGLANCVLEIRISKDRDSKVNILGSRELFGKRYSRGLKWKIEDQ